MNDFFVSKRMDWAYASLCFWKLPVVAWPFLVDVIVSFFRLLSPSDVVVCLTFSFCHVTAVQLYIAQFYAFRLLLWYSIETACLVCRSYLIYSRTCKLVLEILQAHSTVLSDRFQPLFSYSRPASGGRFCWCGLFIWCSLRFSLRSAASEEVS